MTAVATSLPCMAFSWDDSRRAFADAADWFTRTAALVDRLLPPRD